MKPIDILLTQIARQHLGIETLKTRNQDALDFHDVSVGGVKTALLAAYEAGSQGIAPPVVIVTLRAGLVEDVAATQPARIVVEDWDVEDWDTGKPPARSSWEIDAGTAGLSPAQLRRLHADQ
jgi:hypothetical protein